jgi:hypothetical protein
MLLPDPACRPEYIKFGRRNMGGLDFGDIDRMLSNFGICKIPVMVDCLNVKVDCVV